MNKHESGVGNKILKGATKRKPFKPNYDYEVDYNDHFETPVQAYTDILPLLDLLSPSRGESLSESSDSRENNKSIREWRKEHIIYDPYYCNGSTKIILRNLGFSIVHEKRDFYNDIRDQNVPNHHTFVTNPPYSDDHKEKCLQFCVNQFREQNKAFFLLIPNYVAARSYYRQILGSTIHDVAYLIPSSEYSYSHPEGTGHEESPFSSLWFCCIGKKKIEMLKQKRFYYWDGDDTKSQNGRPIFVASFDELISLGVISLENRPNPRQRKKKRKIAAQNVGHGGTTTAAAAAAGIDGKSLDRTNITRFNKNSKSRKNTKEVKGKKRRTNSKYRNRTGERTKKRF